MNEVSPVHGVTWKAASVALLLLVRCSGTDAVGDPSTAGTGGRTGGGGSIEQAGSAGRASAESGSGGDAVTAGSGGANAIGGSAGNGTPSAGSGGSIGVAGGMTAGAAGHSAGSGGISGNAGAGSSGAGAGGIPSACGTGKGVPASNTPTLYASGFESGTLAPYTVCTTKSPNFAKQALLQGQPSAQVYWQQEGYDMSRVLRGAEACSALAFYKEGWYGFDFYLPSPGFPDNKTLGIAQIFSLGGCSSWAGMLQMQNNELWFEHRGNCASPAQYRVRLATALPHNTWLPVVIHFVASHAGAGEIEIWYGKAVCNPASPTYRKTAIDFGFGDWTGDSLTAVDSNQIGLKFGMYNFDDGNYTTGETRTIYYDNVSQLVGNPTGAFATVNPTR